MISQFSYDPSYTYSEDISYPVETINYESGKETRLLRGVIQRSFNLHYEAVTTATKDNILTFFTSQEGGRGSFYWINPNDSITYEVYFLEDTLNYSEVDYGYWDIDFKFVQKL
jgi:phage-related protein